MADFQEFSAPIKYGATIGQALANTVSGDATVSASGVISLAQGLPFVATASFGTPSLNGGLGGGTIITDATITALGSGKYAYVTGFYVKCFQSAGSGASGGSVWAGGTLAIQDSVGTTIWEFPAASVSHETGISAGGTASVLLSKTLTGGVDRGIRIYPSGGSITTNGGTIVVSVWGIIK